MTALENRYNPQEIALQKRKGAKRKDLEYTPNEVLDHYTEVKRLYGQEAAQADTVLVMGKLKELLDEFYK